METSPADLEFLPREGYLEVRALGAYSLPRMKDQLERAVAACRERKAGRLLFDITRITDYAPSTAERFQIGSHIAQLLAAVGRFACLANKEQIDRENFTARVASNRGQAAPVYNDRAEALAWILEKPTPS